MIFAPPEAAASPACPATIVVVAGQSNALGYGLGPKDLPPRLKVADPRTLIWNPSRARFVPMAPGVTNGAPNNPQAWGPEAQFAYRWRQDHPRGTLYLVKYARGETALAPDPKQRDWSPTSVGDVWSKATAQVAGARAHLARRGVTARVIAVLWMQGENDAYDPAKAQAYRTRLTRLIASMRASWGDAGTRVHVGQVNDPGPAKDGWDTVRAAQAAVAAGDPGVVLTDTAKLPRQVDGLHISAAGQIRLGDAFYDAYRQREAVSRPACRG